MSKPTEKWADMNRSQRRIANNLETQTKMLNFAIRERRGKLNKKLFFPYHFGQDLKTRKNPGAGQPAEIQASRTQLGNSIKTKNAPLHPPTL